MNLDQTQKEVQDIDWHFIENETHVIDKQKCSSLWTREKNKQEDTVSQWSDQQT